jgi:dipeptidyl aminopeptidase/acylaminoacyl peptidase
LFLLAPLPFATTANAQRLSLTVEQIMQEQKSWIGGLPNNPSWSEAGDRLYFSWNPGGQFRSDSLYSIPREGGTPTLVAPAERRNAHPRFNGWQLGERIYDAAFRRKVYTEDGDLYLFDRENHRRIRLTKTRDVERDARFTADGLAISFVRDGNVYKIDLEHGGVEQLTDLRSGDEESDEDLDDQDDFLRRQQLALFDYIREQEEEQEARDAALKQDAAAAERPKPFYTGRSVVGSLQVDPALRFVTFTLSDRPDEAKSTTSVSMVTETGYPEEETWRSKVGTAATSPTLYVQDLANDTTYAVDFHASLPGMYDVPAYRREQGTEIDSAKTKRVLETPRVSWSPDGRFAIADVHARDNKDRWLALIDPGAGTAKLLDQQHDEAWIGGPGSFSTGWIPGTSKFYFQSEKTGFSHLYTVDVESGQIRQLTDGQFEIFSPRLSRDARHWIFSSSEVSPFVRHLYRMPLDGGDRVQLTTMEGNNSIEVNPDGVTMANLFSYTNRPPEVYLGGGGGDWTRVTDSPTDAWRAYNWRDPEIIRFEASDGVLVPTQLFVPDNPKGAAVIFVHGAGYLQNVHNWWSSYSREYMFNNLLTDLGYYVMNVDYRGSAGYGRDWRTAIYRHMGGRDLQDHVDASRYLVEAFGLDPERVGLYGGSYGGFITLMALFTEPEHFGAGAALRSVTDWAHYNHGYTSNILNTPATDSLAYALSSPINFADGLEDPLLMPHGMIDNNVHFQDIIRLTQRLIELGKEDWELAVYPVERHGFTEPSSWTDEYRRILKLFETTIGRGDGYGR